MGNRIRLTCESCNHVYDLEKTSEIPEHIFFLRCNWCPECEDTANGYWEEWYDENEIGEPETPTPDNQLCMPFLFDEIGIDKNIKENIFSECEKG